MPIVTLRGIIFLLCLAAQQPVKSEGPAPLSLFVLPKAELRKAPEPKAVVMAPEKSTSDETEDMNLSASRSAEVLEATVQGYESLTGEPLLTRVEMPDEPGGAIGWVETKIWDPVFAPEVIKFGRVKMTGGIVAAIKRRNPFCLLHPLVFSAGW